MLRSSRLMVVVLPSVLATVISLAPANRLHAATWANPVSGDFDTAGLWTGGVPNGASAIADFSTLDLNGDVSVTLNSAKTLGQLLFGDTNLASGGSWELRTDAAATSVITLDNGGVKPTITVNPLTPTLFDDAFIGHNLAGAMGFTKLGDGILTLGPGATHTITGGINIAAGTLRANSAIPGNVVTIGNGATLQTGANFDGGGAGLAAPSGATANLRLTGGNSISNVAPAGATMNVHFAAATPPTLTLNGDWAVGGAAAAYNFTSDTGGFLRLRPNGGNFNTGTAFANAAVTMDNVNMWVRTNSGGNTVNMGSLSGTSTATLNGGAQGGGTAPHYTIGALNTDTEFAGTLDGVTDFGVGNISSLNIVKVGTGTLTFSGNLTNFVPSANASGGTNPWRRGGKTQIQAGTIKLVGTTAIPGGVAATAAGDLQSHIEVGAAGTLDVTGYTAGTYTTPALQSIVGSGNIIGNWNHAAGIIEAGNTLRVLGSTDANANTNNVAGTLTFNGNLTLSGGDIGYSLSLNPNTGNDLIQVTGSANITAGGTIRIQALAGAPSGGTYTVLTAAGGLTGNGGLFTVNLPGRGADPVAFVEGNSLKFNAVAGGGSANLIWTGANGGVWNVETTQAWTNNGSPDVFFDLDTVTFDDTAANKTVTINGMVSPAGVVTVNTNDAYTFAGTGQIVGPVGFTKTGTGNLVFQQGNLFSGAASVTGGSLNIAGNGNALGTGALTLDNVDVVTNAGFTNSSLTVANGVDFAISGAAGSGGAFGTPNLSGSGTINLTTDIVDKWIAIGGNAGYAGTVNVGTAGQAGTFTNLRFTSGGAGFSNGNWSGTVFNILGATTLSNRQGGNVDLAQVIQIGEIHAADPLAIINSFLGGSTAVPTNWIIGGLGTNSDFAGILANGAGTAPSTSELHLTKVGAGTLDLTGVSTYTGDTAVFGGTLRVTNAFFADASIVRINTGGVLNLDTSSTLDTIGALILNGVSVAPGVWGGAGSGAANISPLLSGTGTLMVTTKAIPGDFDGNGTVNGADLTIWQTAFATTSLGDADGDFDSDGGDFMIWQRNLGQSFPVTPAGGAVPEPAAGALAACCMLVVGAARRRRKDG
jgi:autotransporter-associated beta strand protein